LELAVRIKKRKWENKKPLNVEGLSDNSRRLMYRQLSYSLNNFVDRYFSPLSGKITTIVPESILLAVSIAAYIAAPLLMPTKIPSCFTICLAIS